jgi:hypothetical protein
MCEYLIFSRLFCTGFLLRGDHNTGNAEAAQSWRLPWDEAQDQKIWLQGTVVAILHCWGFGSVCFLGLLDPDSLIREVRIQTLLSSSKNSKKNLDSYCSVTSLWLSILEKLCKKQDREPLIRGTDPRDQYQNVTDPQHCHPFHTVKQRTIAKAAGKARTIIWDF